MPEYILAAMTAALLGWGGFTWKRSEDALYVARKASEQIGKIELKMAEEYLTKKDFEKYMDRLFETLGEMKGAVKYVSNRVDYHVVEQSNEIKALKGEVERLRNKAQQRRIDD